MGELIKKGYCKLVSVEPSDIRKGDEDWEWRTKYEGFYGIMYLYQSQQKYPGKYFIVYDVESKYLKTGAGDLITDGNQITLATKNSKYIFKWLETEEKEGD